MRNIKIAFAARTNAGDDFRQLPVVIRAHHEVDRQALGEEIVAQILRHTTENADDRTWIAAFQVAEGVQAIVNFFVRLLADGAGVQ